ncbi:hypothetical protein L596_020051 [Steinernema carpocapsae]|uniref:Galectin n=1 Tax=Steinernema carpocapsae TaxID=34508 RepID=A0A4U5MT76_STECR|nr:hypothetical protein L596_020051 [Steinernema carpocapsae]
MSPNPVFDPIYEGMNHDAEIEIHGEPLCGERTFVIELLTREGIALHLSARHGYMGEHVLVVNSMECGRWQHEDRHCNPFHEGRHFHLQIKNHGSHFSIHVNGHHVCHFHHRIPPHHIVALGIRGDVRVHKIHFERFHHHNGGGFEYGRGYMMEEHHPHHHHYGHHHHHHHGFGHHHHHHHC